MIHMQPLYGCALPPPPSVSSTRRLRDWCAEMSRPSRLASRARCRSATETVPHYLFSIHRLVVSHTISYGYICTLEVLQRCAWSIALERKG